MNFENLRISTSEWRRRIKLVRAARKANMHKSITKAQEAELKARFVKLGLNAKQQKWALAEAKSRWRLAFFGEIDWAAFLEKLIAFIMKIIALFSK